MSSGPMNEEGNTMTVEVTQIPVLKDNYIYIIHNQGTHTVVDPAKAKPVDEMCARYGYKIDYILNTHHHADHIEGISKLQEKYGSTVIGPAKSPWAKKFDHQTQEGETLNLNGLKIEVLDTPGHTHDHIVYHLSEAKKLFCGDVLFGMGCGRVFEGTMNQMWESLKKIKLLDSNTQVYCAHEYTLANSAFAQHAFRANSDIRARAKLVATMRANNTATVPFLLNAELKTNPFLLAENFEEFSKLRKEKDNFKYGYSV